MKITKLQWTIHAIVAFVYTVAMFLLWRADGDVQFWFFFVSTWLMIGNSLLICNHVNKTKDNNSAPMDLSMCVVPAITYVVIIILTVKGPELTGYNASLYLVLHMVVFAISAIVQLLMIKGRQVNIDQEKEIKADILSRDDLIRVWTKIVKAASEDDDLYKFAKKIENEVKYSDPIVPAQLAGLEREIHDRSGNLLGNINNGDFTSDIYIKEAQEILELVKERNERGKILK